MVKKLFIILVICICMLPLSTVSIKAESDIIENDETGIPDRKLYKKILKALKKKSDEKFTGKEAASIERLWLGWGNDIVTFKGLGYLKNLNKLYCGGISTGDLEEIAAEVPQLKRLFVNGYDEEWETSDPPVEERKQELDSLEPLRNMKHLVVLDVSDNNLTSLDGIEGLTKLKVLRADKNQIVNVEEIGRLNQLTKLYLSDNQIENLNGIKNLINLTYLDVSKNNLTSMEGIGQLKNLETLYLSDNRLSGVKGIKKLKKLNDLDLDNNNLKKIGEIEYLKNLDVLHIRNNQLTGVKGIKRLKNLTSLSLEGNSLTKLGEIRQLKKLKGLYLSRNRIKTISNSDLKNLKELRYLDLSENEMKKLPGKKYLKKLKVINLSWNYLTKKEIRKKLKKDFWEGDSLCRWLWKEQKTNNKIIYVSPNQKVKITKDTKEIIGKIKPAKIEGYIPYFYLMLPDGKTVGLDGEKWTAPKADENGIFRIEGLDLREYAGKDVKLNMLLDYEWDITIDHFTVQE